MPDLLAIVPTRGRPEDARQLAEAFAATCTADTQLLLVVDGGDASLPGYAALVQELGEDVAVDLLVNPGTPTMVGALNHAAAWALEAARPAALAFLGDDHRPRTTGWDAAYLEALERQPGLVFGNDLVQGPDLPTQVALSSSVVAALGHMCPPALTHLYVDNYWRDLGRDADCLTYLPHVIVEHLHPVTGRVPWTDGHRRVNTPESYQRDRQAYQAYQETGRLADDVATLTAVLR